MKLIVISAEESFREEITILEALFHEGLEYFHLRKPSENSDGYRNFLEGVNPDFHSKIVLHDHYELTREFDLRGIHKNARNATNWRNYAKQVDHRSVSCHSPEELKQLEAPMSYAFLSPVFDSISKSGYESKFTSEILLKPFETDIPVIALGGVAPSKVALCEEYGFDGVAVLGTIWNNNIPLSAFQEMQKLCQANASTY